MHPTCAICAQPYDSPLEHGRAHNPFASNARAMAAVLGVTVGVPTAA